MNRRLTTIALTVVLWVVLRPVDPAVVRAQYADASPGAPITTGDPRSDGGGPGLMGSPVEIALGIVVLGIVTAVGTTLVVRVTRR